MHGIIKNVLILCVIKNEALEDLKRAVELDPSYRKSAKSNKDFEMLWENQDGCGAKMLFSEFDTIIFTFVQHFSG